MTRLPWLILLLLFALPLVAAEPAPPGPAEPAPPLSSDDREAIKELFERLGQSFCTGNHRLLRTLLVAQGEDEERRLEEIVGSARTEFKGRSYRVFKAKMPGFDERLGANRFDVWVNLHTVCVGSGGNAPLENFHNDTFLLERQSNGSFLIVDSPYFLTIGREQGVGLIADALLVSIGCLVGLVFWVWMGFATFSLRPRRPGWRALVLLLPLLGALLFFVFHYLPAMLRRPSPVAGT